MLRTAITCFILIFSVQELNQAAQNAVGTLIFILQNRPTLTYLLSPSHSLKSLLTDPYALLDHLDR